MMPNYVCRVCGTQITGEVYFTMPNYPVLCSADYQRLQAEAQPRHDKALARQEARRRRIEELRKWATNPRDERDYTDLLDSPDTPAGDIGNSNNREE